MGYFFAKRRKSWKTERCELCKEFACDSAKNKNLTIVRVASPVDQHILRDAYREWKRMIAEKNMRCRRRGKKENKVNGNEKR